MLYHLAVAETSCYDSMADTWQYTPAAHEIKSLLHCFLLLSVLHYSYKQHV